MAGWQNQPSSPSSTASYLYDGHSERVAQQVTQGGSTTTTGYIGDVEEVSTAGSTSTTTTYYYANGKRIALGVNGQISYLASDALGSSTVAFGRGGTATASQLFAPYGGVRYSNGIMPTSFGFTGQRGDSVSALSYFHARYLDRVLGQFTSADNRLQGEGFDVMGPSRYAYVEGNPIGRTDPTGHDACIDDGMGGCYYPDPGGGGDSPPPDPGPLPDPCWSCLDPGYDQGGVYDPPPPPPVDACWSCLDPGYDQGSGYNLPPPEPVSGITCGCSEGGASGAIAPPRPSARVTSPSQDCGWSSPGACLGVGAEVVTLGARAAAPAFEFVSAAAVDFAAVLLFPLASPCDSPPCNVYQAKQPQKSDPDAGTQEKPLTPGDIRKLKNAGYDPHEIKKDWGGSGDLYKDKQGNVVIKPKGGKGPGDPTGINLNDL